MTLKTTLLIGASVLAFLLSLRQFGVEKTRDLFEGAFYLVAIAAALYSVRQYRTNSEREKARWLFDLYQRFYVEQMRKVRERLDWGDVEFITEFITQPEKEKHREELANLDDYLNFFELVAYLERLGQISEGDIRELFDYFLANLGKKPASVYIEKYGYGNLYNLLGKLKYLGA